VCCVQETSAELDGVVRKTDEMTTELQFIGQQLHKLNAFMEVHCLLVFSLSTMDVENTGEKCFFKNVKKR